jgi:AcrR family transcriptional regulator
MNNKARQIMDAAQELFVNQRFHEVTIEDIARSAGVGKGTIYRYFRDKEDLYFKTLLSGLDQLVEQMILIREGNPHGPDELLKLASSHELFTRKHRQLLALLRSEELRKAKKERNLRPEFHRRLRSILEVYAGVISDGVESGRYRPDTDPELVASFLMGMLRAASFLPTTGKESIAEKAVTVLEHGIGDKLEKKAT